MKGTRKILIMLALIMAVPLSGYGAEAPKLRFVTSVYADSKGGNIKAPEGVGCNDGSLFVVADSGGNRLLKYTFKDGILQGGDEIAAFSISRPVRVQVNSKGEIFVLDGKQLRIGRISPEGAFQGLLTPQGIPAPPDFIARNFRIGGNDTLYILDIFSARVLVLDASGKFLRSVPFPDDYGFISDLAVSAQGSVYLIDSAKAVVFVADKDANSFTPFTRELRENVNFASSIALDNSGTVYLADQNGSTIITLNKDGSFQARHLSMGWKDGVLHHPSQLCINSSGALFVADRDNNRVQIFSILP